jgi:hypothetical protein|tara:strand:+ start:1447 stop:1632 length:186 start_codon:yes stop_codon:yes gene_type:complete
LKANFNIKKNDSLYNVEKKQKESENLSQEDFEDFIVKSGAKGSFMVYRSSKKDDELGIDSL